MYEQVCFFVKLMKLAVRLSLVIINRFLLAFTHVSAINRVKFDHGHLLEGDVHVLVQSVLVMDF